MGLDLYAGTLTRYYAHDWETVVQRVAREQGLDMQVVRQSDPSEVETDRSAIREAVLEWRAALSAELSPHLGGPLDWNEGDSQPYITDKPAWDCFGALLLWAAYDEHPGMERPQYVFEESWSEDPALRASSADGFRSRYPSLLYDIELWLPGEFGFTFQGADVAGNTVGIASVGALVRDLEEVNRRLWGASNPQLAQWRRSGGDVHAPAEVKARFGLAVLLPLARWARAAGLPIKLDY